MEKNCTMNEMPRLYGRFKAEFRHADKTLPFLEGSDGKMSADPLLPWSVCGYGTFSGSARYSVELPFAEAGCYLHGVLAVGAHRHLHLAALQQLEHSLLHGFPAHVPGSGVLPENTGAIL